MLQPKRTKFRKQMKGRNRGLALRGSKVSFGEYGLKSVSRGRLTARQIEAGRVKSGSEFFQTSQSPRSRLRFVRVRVKAPSNIGWH